MCSFYVKRHDHLSTIVHLLWRQLYLLRLLRTSDLWLRLLRTSDLCLRLLRKGDLCLYY